MAEYAAKIDEREGLFEFSGFHGLRNNVSAEMFTPADLATALNIDISDALDPSRRKGYSAPVTANIDRDVWASGAVCLGVGSNALKLLHPDYSATTLRTGLTANRPLSYAAVGDRVFYSNGAELGCVQNGTDRSWGLSVPPALTSAAVTGGTLPAGEYQYAVTYMRDDGQESGASRAGTITLDAEGGIALSAIPVSTDATVAYKTIYATSAGGETLYRAGVIANADTTFVIREQRMGTSPLLTQFLRPPPAGDFIAEFHGHMLVAVGSRLYPSEPYAPELFDIRKSIPFEDSITMIAPVSDGVYLGLRSRLLWLPGESPSAWQYKVLAQYGVVPGTLTYGDGDLLGEGNSTEPIALFATTRGLCAGKSGGAFVNLTEAHFAYPIQDRGASIVRRHRGIAQMVCTMSGAETAGNVAA